MATPRFFKFLSLRYSLRCGTYAANCIQKPTSRRQYGRRLPKRCSHGSRNLHHTQWIFRKDFFKIKEERTETKERRF
uniref:Uncharacterized protein n=1 Tax=Ixodes ricinus TaxID=34613 RepID=A0A6B0U4G2_IXORI